MEDWAGVVPVVGATVWVETSVAVGTGSVDFLPQAVQNSIAKTSNRQANRRIGCITIPLV